VGDLVPHIIHDSLSPPEPIAQTEFRSVQPFVHSSCQRVVGHVGHDLLTQNCVFPSVSGHPSNTWFLRSTWLSIPNDISIGSAVFTAHGRKSTYFTMGTPFPKIAPFHGGSGPYLLHDSLSQSKPTTQTASRSVKPFFAQLTAVSLYFTIGRPSPSILPLPVGRPGLLYNTWFFGPTWVLKPNGISIVQPFLVGLTYIILTTAFVMRRLNNISMKTTVAENWAKI